MSTLAGYHILTHRGAQLPRGESVRWKFDPPDDIVVDGPLTHLPILSFRVDPSNDAERVSVSVNLERADGFQSSVIDLTLSGTVSRTFHEPVSDGTVTNEAQYVRFDCTGGESGAVTISDVVMWFHRRV